MSLTRKRKKELRRLRSDATELWEHQQQLVSHAADVAREASRQLGNVGREQILPAVQDRYNRHLAPSVNRGMQAGREVMDNRVLPAVGGVIGSAMSVWDLANAKRQGFARQPAAPVKRGPGAGSIIAIILGVAAAAGVVYAAWQALRTDDELWVADDPLSAPEV